MKSLLRLLLSGIFIFMGECLIKKGIRKCQSCGQIFPLSEKYFYKNRCSVGGVRYECIQCHKKNLKHYYHLNKEKRKIYYLNNREKILEHERLYHGTPRSKFEHYQLGAQRRKIEWDLSFEKFKKFWQKPCYYCGSQIETIGLDRKNNNEGYNIDNIVPCCQICNILKGQQSSIRWIELCKKVALLH